MFERIAAISASVDAERIENSYRESGRVDWQRSGLFRNTIVYTDAMTMRGHRRGNLGSSAKLGRPPKMVAMDYVQLTDGTGSTMSACPTPAKRRVGSPRNIMWWSFWSRR
jgi:hypothetical protein